ncbi:MAG: sensor histidine kinase [Anaerovoracaceae bacterium]
MEKMKYRMSSRATILLGRESVSRVDGAIIELIKNTYDADSGFCYLCFDVENDRIYLLDNGVGMTKSVIETCWMLIGTDNKRVEYLSAKDRIKSGEKGIGRFALDRLGSKCKMYTKHHSEDLICWETDWSNFERAGQSIDDVEADFSYCPDFHFEDIIPLEIKKGIEQFANDIDADQFALNSGTLFIISGLRDKWTAHDKDKVIDVLGYLIPPVEQQSYVIITQNDLKSDAAKVDSEVAGDYDYRVYAHFDGEKITATVFRNEFDLHVMPKDLFNEPAFCVEPYRMEDFAKESFEVTRTVAELTGNSTATYADMCKQVGPFDFHFTFMKLSSRSEGPYYYKEVSRKRKVWMENHGGLKIYRDNFVVRPYGDPISKSYDWLGLDARKGINPVAISDKSEQWHVNNSQMQGTILISRVLNASILDKANREGIIENEFFETLSVLLIHIIAIFEKDRAHIVRNIKQYSDNQNQREKAKEDASDIAKALLSKKRKRPKEEKTNTASDTEKLAEAVQIFQEEREELISEIKMLRALATNGLMTTTMVHDLKSINALLVSRVRGFRLAIKQNDTPQIQRNLDDLQTNDEFLKSWITVITTQTKKDRRKRLKKDIYKTIAESLKLIKPILSRKMVTVNFSNDGGEAYKKVFATDFDSIIYNLIINSIESFEETKVAERLIDIFIESGDMITIHYSDNGHGLTDAFRKNPYSIFEYGTTSKFDTEGKPVGTGLGMYIVASSINEYNGRYTITKVADGFGLDITIPLPEEGF